MTSLSKHKSSTLTKLLLLGDSGSGKTGSLVSLVAAGYKLRILDFDNGLDILKAAVLRTCPDKIDNVESRPLRDKYKAQGALGPQVDGQPKAFIDGISMLDRWKYKDENGEEIDLGVPSSWGSECVLVLDSFSFFCDSAYAWAEFFVPKSKEGKFDPRMVYGNAQNAAEHVLALLTSDSFATNVIVTAHVKYMDMPDGTMKGFPVSIGKALSPTVPRYFNSTALCQSSSGGKRTIQTISTGLVDLKNTAAFSMAAQMPIETGLADFFATVRGTKK